MTRITSRFAMMIATAAVLPLVVYGVVSLWSLRTGTQRSVREGNLNVATRAAEQIHLYITNNVNVLKALGAELRGTHLEPWQQDRILKNYVLDFPEFRELTLFDASGMPIATSRAGTPDVTDSRKRRSRPGRLLHVVRRHRRRPAADDDDCDTARCGTAAGGSSASSVSSSCGGWSIGSASASEGYAWSSARTAGCSRTATRTRSAHRERTHSAGTHAGGRAARGPRALEGIRRGTPHDPRDAARW